MRYSKTLLVIVVLAVLAAPVLAQQSGTVSGRPDISLSAPDDHVTPGERTTLEVTVSNAGDLSGSGPSAFEQEVMTARNLRLEVRESRLERRYDDEIQLKSGPVAAGNAPQGATGPFSFVLEFDESVEPGEYEIPIRVSYEYTSSIAYNGSVASSRFDSSRTVTRDVTVVVEEGPRFEIRTVTSDVFLGDSGTLALEIENVGSRRATDSRISLRSENPSVSFDGSESATVHVGDWPVEETRTVSVPITTAPGAIATNYSVQVQPTYENQNGIAREGARETIGVSPRSGHRFEIVNVSSTVAAGETGPLEVTLRNRGTVPVTDATVRLESASPTLSFEGQPATSQFVGGWEPGDNRTVTVDATLANATEARERVVQATVNYDARDGSRSQAGPYETSVPVGPEQSFSIESVDTTLRGNTAIVRGVVRNTGTSTVENAVVTLESLGPSVTVREPTAPVGTLEPDETAQVTFDLRVSPDAYPGVRQFNARVAYDRDDRTYRSDPVSVRANFPTDRELFDVEPVNATFEVDSSNQLRVRITNTGEETLTDVRGRLTNVQPYESQGPSSYAGTLESGESAILTFEVTTPDDAVPTNDSVSINVSAESPDGQSVVAGPYLVPVRIAGTGPASGNVISLVVGAVVVLVLLGAGWWWLNR
ncbi:MAG: COG1361 S-layer family protein [Halodesulfurarchaeum sp.]